MCNIDLDDKLVIENKDNGLHAQWDCKTILFNTEEEANDFIEQNYYFFEDAEYEIVDPPEDAIEFIENFINFKDIKDIEEYKESICYKN